MTQCSVIARGSSSGSWRGGATSASVGGCPGRSGESAGGRANPRSAVRPAQRSTAGRPAQRSTPGRPARRPASGLACLGNVLGLTCPSRILSHAAQRADSARRQQDEPWEREAAGYVQQRRQGLIHLRNAQPPLPVTPPARRGPLGEPQTGRWPVSQRRVVSQQASGEPGGEWWASRRVVGQSASGGPAGERHDQRQSSARHDQQNPTTVFSTARR
jgi:hypothetical protein